MKTGNQDVGAVVADSGIRKEFAQRGFRDVGAVSFGVRTETGRKFRKAFKRVRKEAEFAMGSSGRVQPDVKVVMHADLTGVG